VLCLGYCVYLVFFLTDSSTTEIFTLSLHDALPIFRRTTSSLRPGGIWSDSISVTKPCWYSLCTSASRVAVESARDAVEPAGVAVDRKSTRLNSSHVKISYAVFCLKKKKNRMM